MAGELVANVLAADSGLKAGGVASNGLAPNVTLACDLQMTQRIRALKRQLNEAEEETGRKDTQYRHAQRELAEEREAAGRLQRQLLDQNIQTK